MNGWYLLYVLAIIINAVLIGLHTDLTLGDVVFWIWSFVPFLAHTAGREWWDRGGEE